MAASNTDDRDDELPEEPAPPADRSEDAARDPDARPAAPYGTPDELPDETVDARFADLVASLGELGTDSSGAARTALPDPADRREGLRPSGPGWSGTFPAGDDTRDDTQDDDGDDDAGRRARPADDAGTGSPAFAPRPSGPRDWPVTPEVEALEEAEGHYAPPEPEPLLSDKDPLLTMAWFAVSGIPILALISVIVVAAIPELMPPPVVGQVAVGLFLAGLGVLLWRMPHRRDPEDNDPGAVV